MKLLLAILVGLLAGTGGYTFYYANGFSYFSNDPRACVNCHIMRDQYDSWRKSSHHAWAVCNDCHVPHDFVGKYLTKGENGYHHSEAFTFQNFHEPIQIRPRNLRVLNQDCLYCHREFTSEIRVTHGRDANKLDCIHCHDNVGHGPSR